jgi:host factor-I protein
MQSFFDRRAPTLDTAQPSIRHIQDLIRREAPVAIRMADGQELEGLLRWQDLQYFALDPGEGRPLVLINRHVVSVLRPLG